MQHPIPSVWRPAKSVYFQVLWPLAVIWKATFSRLVMPARPAGKKTGMVATLAVLAVCSVSHVKSQGLDLALAMSSECVESNQKAMANVATGRLAEAEEELSASLTRVGNGAAYSCAGLILHNMATIASISGKFAEGERLAAR